MKAFLRVLIILILMLAGVSLYLSIRLFDQREELRGRTEMMETKTVKLATYIEAEQAEDLATQNLPTMRVSQESLKRYYHRDAEGKVVKDQNTGKRVTTGPDTLDAVLRGIISKADNQLVRMNETRVDLQQTRGVLAQTQRELKKTQDELRVANNTIEDMKEQMDERVKEIAERDVKIGALDLEKEELNKQIQSQTEQIAKLEDRGQELKTEVAEAERRIKELEAEVARLKAGVGPMPTKLARGPQGRVLSVSPEWNFVVLGVGPETPLAPNVELLVKRGSSLVGKVRVLYVKADEQVAIADIINPWLQLPIQKGDNVIF